MIEGDRVRQVAANAAAHVATDLQAKLAAAQAEYGFKLGVALEALRHVGHVLRGGFRAPRSEGHTSELQSLMRTSYAVFCLKKQKLNNTTNDKWNSQTLQE